MIKNYIKDKFLEEIIVLIMIGMFSSVLFLYDINLEPILYSSGLVILFLIIISFIDFKRYKNKHNELKFIEENLELKNIEIKQTLIDRDYLAIIEKLYKENTKLKTKLDLDKSEMIDYYTLWAHQIKNPIAGINLILQNSNSEDKGDLLEEIFKVEEYVGMVLGYLRFVDGESDLIIREESLDRILKNSIKKYSKLFIRKKLALEYKECDLTIITDEKWLSFGIEQILSNSIKYTKKGKISIYVKDNTIYIKDTGIGIKEEDLPRIFQKGFTGYNGRMDKKSTGIGLYLSKKIFEKLGYKLDVESKENVGTTVKIKLNMDIMLDY